MLPHCSVPANERLKTQDPAAREGQESKDSGSKQEAGRQLPSVISRISTLATARRELKAADVSHTPSDSIAEADTSNLSPATPAHHTLILTQQQMTSGSQRCVVVQTGRPPQCQKMFTQMQVPAVAARQTSLKAGTATWYFSPDHIPAKFVVSRRAINILCRFALECQAVLNRASCHCI